ncbi:lasso peptide biosynthesis PqqD family chaperone [Pseudalkalibacillus hwajinpoensis]|uniref:lasso peptide biosynthesis PqqD family chaperone n=1 Tax=Guptibacillus hwajinpoensis TaxID=208199 RepID=UPI001CFCC23B|nr:lasso peptide biosynthesis PqqD family chaperone [Pseudalkalibacillus hwajinpoensis]
MLKKQTFTAQQTITQAPGNIVSDMDGEKVMLSIHNGKYFNLGYVGGEIWDQIAEPILINVLVLRLMEVFEVDRHTCEEDVYSFLENLLEQGLVQVN